MAKSSNRFTSFLNDQFLGGNEIEKKRSQGLSKVVVTTFANSRKLVRTILKQNFRTINWSGAPKDTKIVHELMTTQQIDFSLEDLSYLNWGFEIHLVVWQI